MGFVDAHPVTMRAVKHPDCVYAVSAGDQGEDGGDDEVNSESDVEGHGDGDEEGGDDGDDEGEN